MSFPKASPVTQTFFSSCLAIAFAATGSPSTLDAQQINTSVPYTSTNSGFYENHGVNFGFSIPGGRGNGSRVVGLNHFGQLTPSINFQQGGVGSVNPTFGGFNPNSGANFGFGRRNANGGGFNFGFSGAKGSNRQSTTTTPSLTTQNGFGGSLTSGSVRPFVTGVVPILGHGGAPIIPDYRPAAPNLDNGVTRALASGQLNLGTAPVETPHVTSRPVRYADENSSALSGDFSVNKIKAERKRKLAAKKRKVESIMVEAAELESQRNYSDARTKYREALRETDDEDLESRIKNLIKATRMKG